MFFSYDEFILESKTSEALEKAKGLMKSHKELMQVLVRCQAGEYTKIQMQTMQGAKSYVAVATNSGSPESRLFKTSDPKKALLAMIIASTGVTDSSEIIGMIEVKDSMTEYGVFPGERKMTHDEMKAKYNVSYDSHADVLPMFVGTPISKKF